MLLWFIGIFILGVFVRPFSCCLLKCEELVKKLETLRDAPGCSEPVTADCISMPSYNLQNLKSKTFEVKGCASLILGNSEDIFRCMVDFTGARHNLTECDDRILRPDQILNFIRLKVHEIRLQLDRAILEVSASCDNSSLADFVENQSWNRGERPVGDSEERRKDGEEKIMSENGIPTPVPMELLETTELVETPDEPITPGAPKQRPKVPIPGTYQYQNGYYYPPPPMYILRPGQQIRRVAQHSNIAVHAYPNQHQNQQQPHPNTVVVVAVLLTSTALFILLVVLAILIHYRRCVCVRNNSSEACDGSRCQPYPTIPSNSRQVSVQGLSKGMPFVGQNILLNPVPKKRMQEKYANVEQPTIDKDTIVGPTDSFGD